MATIGLDKLYYAPITADEETGEETYETPVALAPAITAELSVNLASAILYADDKAEESVNEFASGELTLNTSDLPAAVVAALTGAVVDKNGVLIQASEDSANPVAIAFRAKKANGTYRYFWLYHVVFGPPSTTANTKADSIEFQTPTITGTITARIKPDSHGNHPWKAEVTEGDTGASTAITSWYTQVYEPTYAAG